MCKFVYDDLLRLINDRLNHKPNYMIKQIVFVNIREMKNRAQSDYDTINLIGRWFQVKYKTW